MGGGDESAAVVAALERYLTELRAARPSLDLADGLSPKGSKTLAQIIVAAHRVFIRDGHAGLSMRKVADEAGLAVGNVNYYFESKRALIEATLREAFSEYVEVHARQFEEKRHAPIEIVLDMLTFYISSGRHTHPFFFQLWSYAASDAEAKALVRELYQPIGRFVYYLLRAAKPHADDLRIREITLQIISLEEGVKLLIGLGPEDDRALRSAETHMRNLAEKLILAD
ncbi:MAG: TetR/AcrR family transcriptional regulator [Pseudomonadota bacterium]